MDAETRVHDSGRDRHPAVPPFTEHEQRAAIVGEVHARPFELIATPRRVFHFAALDDEDSIACAREALARLCGELGVEPPGPSARHFRAAFDGWHLRWERHTEFTSYTWHHEPEPDARSGPPLDRLPVAGRVMVAVRLDLVAGGQETAIADRFDRASVCLSEVEGAAARIATDFRLGADGYTDIVIENVGLGEAAAGQLVQRVLEIETYRTLALLAFPQAVEAGPEVSRIEAELTRITVAMNASKGLKEDHALLDRLTYLAAGLEAQTSSLSFRLGAARAYHHIVETRLASIGETTVAGHRTWTGFLARRLGPAMRTCASVEERQEALSQRLSRAANLLRTRLDVERANQNNALLRSMNQRVRLQLRLQQTVEGLSVAAVSYYVVGLIAYLIKGGAAEALPLSPDLLVALAVPVVVLVMWLVVKRIRRKHAEDPH